jgi:hypothetical protein
LLELVDPEDRPEMPLVPEWAEAPWRAWHDLHAERTYVVSGYSVAMGGMMIQSTPCSIPWTAVVAWCDRAGFADEERTEFIAPIVAALDREFIAHNAAQRTKQAPEDKLSRWDSASED